MATLRYIEEQKRKIFNEVIVESDLTVLANYDPQTHEVWIENVYAYDRVMGRMVDVTQIFERNPILSRFLDEINWRELYAEQEEIALENE